MNEYLHDALEEISDEKIAEAVMGRKRKRLTVLKAACAACVVIAVAAAVVHTGSGRPKNDDRTQCQADALTAAAANVAGGEAVPGGAEISREKKWDEKEDNEKYIQLSFNGKTYLSTGMKAEQTEIGDQLGTATAEGSDIYTNKSYETECEVYSAGGFGSEFLVAVKFGSDGKFYPYKSENYFPSDLGGFCEALNFFENIEFDRDVILSSDSDVSGSQIRLYDGETLINAACGLLKNNGSAKALEYASENMPADGVRVLEFGVSSPLLSRYSLFLSVSEDGYIMTNLVDVGVSFFVGKDTVKPLFEAAEKSGGEKYVASTTPVSPDESEQTAVTETTFAVSQSTEEYAADTVYAPDTIEVTQVYSQNIQTEE